MKGIRYQVSGITQQKRQFGRVCALVILMFSFVGLNSTPATAQKPNTFERYQPLEFPLSIKTVVKNPYNPAQLDVSVVLTAPDGRTFTVVAFYMVPFRNDCTQNCAAERLVPDGDPGWRFRFTPDVAGTWTYTVTARSETVSEEPVSGQFEVIGSKRPGFVRVAENRRYFAYDDQTPYFAIGMNLGWSWSGGGGTLTYLRWLQGLKRVGANYARLVIDVPWFIDLEAKPPLGDYANAQQDAWKLDTILKTAEEMGIALQLVLVWSQSIANYSYSPVGPPQTPLRPDMRSDWATNPNNASIGGAIAIPAAFFSNEPTRNFFKRRLRYIAARWGASPAVFAWELIDQLDRTAATNGAMSDWLKEMAETLRAADPARHLITAGIRDGSKNSLLIPAALDFRIARQFQRRPVEVATEQIAGIQSVLKANQFDKQPTLITEFSLNPWFEPTADDPTGVHVIESMWATALSGAAGSAMPTYWDTYLFPQDIVKNMAALAAFTRDVPWHAGKLQIAETTLQSDEPAAYQPLKITAFNPNFGGKKAADVTYRVSPDGIDPPIEGASSFLYTARSNFYQPQKYRLNIPIETTITIKIQRMPVDRKPARLRVLLDDRLAAELAIPQRSEPTAITLPISTGEHILTLDNVGEDALQLEGIEIAAYIPPLRAVSLADRENGIYLGWLQHRDYTWETVAKKKTPKPVNFQLTVGEMPPGVYRVELWEPASGNIAGEEMVTVTGSGSLTIQLLPVDSMLAVRAFRVS